MKVGVTIGETMDGKWETLALPDKQVQAQRAAFKALQIADGALKVGKTVKQYKKIYFFDRAAKHVKCDPNAKQARLDAELAAKKASAERAAQVADKVVAAAKAALEVAEANKAKAQANLNA